MALGGRFLSTNELRICGHWQMAEICPVLTTNSQGYPRLVVVYSTYLWWFRGWFIIVLTTLLLKLLKLEPPYFTSLRNGSSWCRYLSEPSAAFWISSAAKHQYFRSQYFCAPVVPPGTPVSKPRSTKSWLVAKKGCGSWCGYGSIPIDTFLVGYSHP